MTIEQRIQKVAELGALALNINEAYIINKAEYVLTEEDMNEFLSYSERKRKLIAGLVDAIKSLESLLTQERLNRILSSDYELLLHNYFTLIERVLFICIGSPTVAVEKFSSVESILILADEVDLETRNLIKSKNSLKNIDQELHRRVVEQINSLEREMVSLTVETFNSDNILRIDAELDGVKASLNKKVRDIAQQYTVGREDLIKSVDEYKSSIEMFIDGGAKSIEKCKQEINALESELDEKRSEINAVKAAAEACLELVRGVLTETSQVGMAGAFQERHKSLKTSMIIWFVAFFVCLCGLTFVGVVFVMSAFSSEIKTAVELVSKIAITFPLVWGAWFSAKQYSHVSQLREDYAYKVAVAMTYHGYKGEAADVNKEMSGKLLDSIIAQFSDNPVRLYQNNNSASVIEAMLKNDKFSDIINSAKNGMNGSAK